ncbi:MAG: branched-chain amino acid ABC transporter permease [Pseudomonadota bacterium]
MSWSLVLPVTVFVALAVLPFWAQATKETFYISMAARVIVYAIACTALNLALGYGGLISFGHALFLGLGGYAVSISANAGFGSGFLHLGLTVAVCGLVALITGLISLRTSGIAFIMITLAFAQMGYFLFISLKQYGGDDGLPVSVTSKFFGWDLGDPAKLYWTCLIFLVLVTWWAARVRNSPFGMVLRGAEQNARRVRALGFSLLRYQIVLYVASGVVCGIAGMLLANLTAFTSPSNMSWHVSGELIVMLVIGGVGSVFGPLLGALTYLGFEEWAKGQTQHWMVFFGPAIVLIVLLGKGGVVGLLARMDKVMEHRRKLAPASAAPDAAERSAA